ncbi:MAG: TetR/AcrR family transcriptional regulator [Pseudomonadota bacterium]
MSKAGRPKQFNQNEALYEATKVFWAQGYSATSMDDLGAAMGLNRPSIYNTFGNKESLYREAMGLFCGQLDQGINECLDANTSIRQGLTDFFERALDVYCASEPGLGCLMICTAPAEAINSESIGSELKSLINRLDTAFEENLKRGVESGELKAGVDTKLVAMTMQATLHTIALRARAGGTKKTLKNFTRFSVAQLPWA